MSREIRFRAWDGELGEMLDHDSAHWFYGSNGLEAGYNAGHSHPTIGEGDWVELEIMQYTGLKDSNGVEIYESDLVDYLGSTYEIVYGDRTPEFHLKGCSSDDDWTLGGAGWEKVKVIGNRFDNPDLLPVEVEQ